MRHIVLVFILFLVVHCSWGQQKGCKQKILTAVKEMATHTKPKKGKYYYYKIRTEISYHPELSLPSSQLTSEIIIGSEISVNRSDFYELYIDGEDQFLVLHPQKLVNWSPGPTDSKRDSLFQMTSFYQDSLIRSSLEKECEETIIDKQKCLKVGLRPNEEVRANYGLKYLEVTINLKTKKIKQVKNYFNGTEQVNTQTCTYQKVDYNYNTKVYSSASKYLFEKDRTLVKRLKDYQLLDLRDHEALEVQ